MSDVDLIADAREWLATQGGRIQTHSEICHRWHPACLVSRLLSRAGQTEAKARDFYADCPERESTDHDAAPAARAQTDSAAGEPGGGHDSDRTDKAVTRPVLGTGDTPEPHATPGQGTSQGGCTLTAHRMAGSANRCAVRKKYASLMLTWDRL